MGVIHAVLSALFPPQPEPISELRVGSTALCRGTVVARDLMESPLTGEPCVYYQYTIEEWRKSRIAGLGGDGFWQLTRRDEAIVEFYLQDGDARAIIAPQRARIERARGVAARPVDLGSPDQRAQELLLCPGDQVEVLATVGRAYDLYDDRRAYRESAARVMLHARDSDDIVIRLLGH